MKRKQWKKEPVRWVVMVVVVVVIVVRGGCGGGCGNNGSVGDGDGGGGSKLDMRKAYKLTRASRSVLTSQLR